MSYCLIDLNQVLIANLMQHLANPYMLVENNEGKLVKISDNLNEGLVRHMALNTIRSYIKQFKHQYSDFVLCCDNKKYWRKEYFPFYKSHRKADREASGYDWAFIFDTLNMVRDELKECFPYKVIDVEGAEADDVIAVLTARFAPHSEILILSSDKDFAQLQKYPNVSQFSPSQKRFIKVDDPKRYVREHIMRGDRGDGIPNFLSPDNCFVVGERQKAITTKKLNEWVTKNADEFCTTDAMLHGYQRNKKLVDFDEIPTNIQSNIIESFEVAKPATKQKLLDYFINKGLHNLIENIQDF